jgi:hypothetical protein
MTAIHFAANSGHFEVVKILMDAHAKFDASDEVKHFYIVTLSIFHRRYMFYTGFFFALLYIFHAFYFNSIEWVDSVPLGHCQLSC